MSDSSIPRPEYPRPQFVRTEWLNLNGEWEFAFDDAGRGLNERWYTPEHGQLPLRITVPFAYQTACSDLNDKGIHEVIWYARNFVIPAEWEYPDILLHFGAVDYRTTVWVNGEEVGHNQGGNVPFQFNIAPYVRDGENRLVVRVEDRQDVHQPRGKQSSTGQPSGIDYYCTSGIWQTVWLEPVPTMRIEECKITPLIRQEAFDVLVYLHAPWGPWRLKIQVFDEGELIVEEEQDTTNATSRILLAIPGAKRWSPEDPHLYTLKIALYQDTLLLDSVETYAGLRSVHIQGGYFLLNEMPCYLKMVLDQGYWPDGGLTAPTDEALKADVEWAKKYGFNGVRKHQKIEDPRWLYWCDKLGLMVWSEMANARAWSPASEEMLIAEWERAVHRDYNHPCVVTWVPMNESWGVPGLAHNHPGQYAYLERIVARTRRLDQYRPVIDNDGWEHTDISDIIAIHDYAVTGDELKQGYAEKMAGGKLRETVWANNIKVFARNSEYRGQPIMITEMGGFLIIPKDIPAERRDELYKWYGSVNDSKELLKKYEDLIRGLSELAFVAGFCYTQLADVEQEMNGLLTYDRQAKVEPEKIAAIHRRLLADRVLSI